MYVTAAARLRLLGDETRLRLLRLLAREPLNVTELTAVLGVAQSGVSRHLALLREAYVNAPAHEPTRIRIPMVMQAAVVVLAIGVFVVGLYPAPLFDITDSVSAVIFPS